MNEALTGQNGECGEKAGPDAGHTWSCIFPGCRILVSNSKEYEDSKFESALLVCHELESEGKEMSVNVYKLSVSRRRSSADITYSVVYLYT